MEQTVIAKHRISKTKVIIKVIRFDYDDAE